MILGFSYHILENIKHIPALTVTDFSNPYIYIHIIIYEI